MLTAGKERSEGLVQQARGGGSQTGACLLTGSSGMLRGGWVVFGRQCLLVGFISLGCEKRGESTM